MSKEHYTTSRRQLHFSSLTLLPSFLFLLAVLVLSGCERERRDFRQEPPATRVNAVVQSDLHPGTTMPVALTKNPLEQNAYQVNEGKRLYEWYNCSGCHAHGGGDIGPPLMDEKWVYGSDASNIYATIVEGRPNGMPSFRQKIPEQEVWQLVAYVRSMSGQLRKDVSPTRDDDMSVRPSEQRQPKRTPLNSSQPPSSERAP